MVEKGTMRSLEVSKVAKNSSCLGWFVCGCCWLAFHERVPWLLGTSKNCNNPLKLRGESYKGGLWFFVRLLKQSLKKVDMCCVHVFMFCQVERFMSPNVNGNLNTRGSQMWFLGFVWSVDFEKKKKGQWAQKKEIRVIWPLRNLKPFFDEEGKVLNG
jgi:hypothetical protein